MTTLQQLRCILSYRAWWNARGNDFNVTRLIQYGKFCTAKQPTQLFQNFLYFLALHVTVSSLWQTENSFGEQLRKFLHRYCRPTLFYCVLRVIQANKKSSLLQKNFVKNLLYFLHMNLCARCVRWVWGEYSVSEWFCFNQLLMNQISLVCFGSFLANDE